MPSSGASEPTGATAAVCGRCGAPLPETATPDANGWCAACRAQVVRTSTRLALAGVVTWLAFKVGRRVAFDVVRSRPRAARRRT